MLPTFFSHSDASIALGRCYNDFWEEIDQTSDLTSLAAFSVYVRRAYRAYNVLTIDYEEGDGMDDGEAPHIVTWHFKIGQSNSPPSTPQMDERK